MLVAGTQIDPKEWWDEHWIHDRILSKIGPQAGTETVETAKNVEPETPHRKKRHGRR
jgi:hypothetical protein